MAPELIQGKQYDAKADIWSFGITALELTQGRPPRSRESPQRVLLRTSVLLFSYCSFCVTNLSCSTRIQEDPPTLERDGGVHKYSRGFKEIIDWCLNKDPAKRLVLSSHFYTSILITSQAICTRAPPFPIFQRG